MEAYDKIIYGFGAAGSDAEHQLLELAGVKWWDRDIDIPSRPKPYRQVKKPAKVSPYIDGLIDSGRACSHPIRLVSDEVIDTTTGEITAQDKAIVVPCHNRRYSVCPACAKQYQLDAYHLVKSPFSSGDSLTWVTLTAGSMGVIKDGKRISCLHHEVGQCLCGKTHQSGAKVIGQPFDSSRFAYDEAASFNKHSGKLFSDFIRQLKRVLYRYYLDRFVAVYGYGDALADEMAKARVKDLRYLRVAEIQERGLVHHHVAFAGKVRLEHLEHAQLLAAVTADGFRHQYGQPFTNKKGQTVNYGLKAEVIGAGEDVERIASYVSKYLTKSFASSIDPNSPASHYSTLCKESDRLEESYADGKDECYAYVHHKNAWSVAGMKRCPCSRCRAWRFASRAWEYLGLRGHIMTKSQNWGISFKSIRESRRAFIQGQLKARYEMTSEVVSWNFAGQGYAKIQEKGLEWLAMLTYLEKRQHKEPVIAG